MMLQLIASTLDRITNFYVLCPNFYIGPDYALFWCYLGKLCKKIGDNLASKF